MNGFATPLLRLALVLVLLLAAPLVAAENGYTLIGA